MLSYSQHFTKRWFCALVSKCIVNVKYNLDIIFFFWQSLVQSTRVCEQRKHAPVVLGESTFVYGVYIGICMAASRRRIIGSINSYSSDIPKQFIATSLLNNCTMTSYSMDIFNKTLHLLIQPKLPKIIWDYFLIIVSSNFFRDLKTWHYGWWNFSIFKKHCLSKCPRKFWPTNAIHHWNVQWNRGDNLNHACNNMKRNLKGKAPWKFRSWKFVSFFTI